MYEKNLLINSYEKHNELVRRLIPEDRLLELDISMHKSTKILCEFLGLPARFIGNMPVTNTKPKKIKI